MPEHLRMVELAVPPAAAPVVAAADKVTARAADTANAAVPPATEPTVWAVALPPRTQAIPHCA